eukprot:15443676-Alexandrium_andersonii.AAC.1
MDTSCSTPKISIGSCMRSGVGSLMATETSSRQPSISLPSMLASLPTFRRKGSAPSPRRLCWPPLG